ncbi:nucleoid-associated protein [Mangrovimonas aestuarii]|uniref:nucleoid-associated protein n=1 Tax=Mangrovimonas aestuarii TaxID=3018443 RepID=UPI0023785866|nr:nucleoid-associated protein [Mangrovimonas aestuarii]
MIKRHKATISRFIIHKVGNKFNDTRNAFSEQEVQFDEASYDLMLPFLLRPFTSVVQSYRFNHHADISMNEINRYSERIFQEDGGFVETSKHIVTHLYEQSNSAQIKTGDVLVVLFEDIQYNEIFTNAVGIFKIESKINFFQTFLDDNSYDVVVQNGISTKKVDKGCLIINTSEADGRVVLSVDNNTYDTQYWINHFLNIKYANDSNLHTQNYMEFCKDFSTEVLKTDFGAQEHTTFLAKTVDYFKENEVVNLDHFKEEVFEEEKHKELFDNHRKMFEEELEIPLHDNFQVSEAVVKKQKQKLKTEIKLDTHIQIKLDVDAPDASSEYMERGYDEEKKMHYYKVFFNEEG